MRFNTCCFIGPKAFRRDKLPEILEKTRREVTKLAEEGIRNFVSTGLTGFDAICCLAVLHAKEKIPELRLICIVPKEKYLFHGYGVDRKRMEYICEHADELVVCDAGPSERMEKRTRQMVKKAAVCLAYLPRFEDGTEKRFRYAISCGLECRMIK